MSAAASHLLYLHGFRSSPRSTKARFVEGWVRAHRPEVVWSCPQLPASPRAAIEAARAATAGWPHARMAVIGSSLGGFYATVLAERSGCRAVVLNPAVEPARDLARHVGTTTTWHEGAPFEFRSAYLDELRALAVPAITHPQRYHAVIAKGDELLSWREMAARYAGASVDLLEGSDHALSEFAAQWPRVLRFLGLEG
jgi:predicted esterase YcpF (UPF0227 family)